ncbi:hypothetical protein M408DRAFT_23120 [Serendipita vermifera MAFF 305830]|uniref:Uncharacterized protein n=1 Tax=Serendipita vermifera MAFF 305830 TaxID=933852 RepID=A0A0C3BD29_SERVB|nr:hypothetical protein M408DRAFT_23120 [Serendipita vermifera MAFF 305830]
MEPLKSYRKNTKILQRLEYAGLQSSTSPRRSSRGLTAPAAFDLRCPWALKRRECIFGGVNGAFAASTILLGLRELFQWAGSVPDARRGSFALVGLDARLVRHRINVFSTVEDVPVVRGGALVVLVSARRSAWGITPFGIGLLIFCEHNGLS